MGDSEITLAFGYGIPKGGAVVSPRSHDHPVHLPCRPMISLMSYTQPDPHLTAQADLLAALLSPSPSYPWEPSQAETYFAAAGLGDEDDALEASLTEGWQQFSAQMNAQWGRTAVPLTTAIVQYLKGQIQDPLPDDLLHTIAATVATLRHSGQAYLDQLVACAQAVLPTWDTGDLAVLARPLAYSLRDGQNDILDLNLRTTLQSNWQGLSEIEQARLSLTLAALALKAAENQP